jgi:hypothetical protein
LFDPDAKRQLPFSAPRPERFWQVTWSFALEPLDAEHTRLRVRARAAFPESGRVHAAWIRPVHSLMQSAMLRHLKARVEGTLPRDDFRDVIEGIGGAAVIVAAFATPFLERARRHWGLDEALAARRYPGDELVPEPHWSFTHGVEIDAPAERVWEWVAQIGADRAGFYSYQWLENVLGTNVRNAETIHPEWQLALGETLVLHPDPSAPRMQVAALEPGRWLVATSVTEPNGPLQDGVWANVSWLFFVEPLPNGRSRLISRFRAACSNDLAPRLALGPALLGPVSFAMDRRMLLGIKRRAERATRAPT